MDIDDVETYVKIAGGVLTAIGVIWKYGKKFYNWIISPFKRIKQVHDQVGVIFKELTPNGGGSLKDKITNMEGELKKNTGMTEIIYNQQKWMLNKRPEPIFRSDYNGNCVWVNDKYLKTFERNMDECIGAGWINLVHFDDRDKVFKDWDYSVKNNIAFESKYRIVSKSGTIFQVFCKADRIENKGYLGELEILDVLPFKA